MNASPLDIGRQTDRKRAEAREAYALGRRRDAARNGYTGPLTRGELIGAQPLTAAQRRSARFRPMGVR